MNWLTSDFAYRMVWIGIYVVVGALLIMLFAASGVFAARGEYGAAACFFACAWLIGWLLLAGFLEDRGL